MATKHSDDCRMTFGRKDPNCPRCQELLNGAQPRGGWGRQHAEAARIAAIRNHDCRTAGCGPICTAFDY